MKSKRLKARGKPIERKTGKPLENPPARDKGYGRGPWRATPVCGPCMRPLRRCRSPQIRISNGPDHQLLAGCG